MPIIDRTGSSALMPEDTSQQIVQGMVQRSAVMQLGRRLPNMSRAQRRMPVLSALPTAYFVDGDTGQKQTTEMAWGNKTLDAEELAVIVPIPEAVLDDTDYDIWGEVRPRIEEAMGAAFDAAVLYGTNAPLAWPDDIFTAAIAAGNSLYLGDVEAGGGDIYDAILSEDGVISLVEEDGFAPTGHVAAMTMRARLRGLRDTNGQPIFMRSLDRGDMQGATRYELDGEPIYFPRNGAIDAATALMFSGDFSQLVYSMRQDLTYKVLDQAVIQNADGTIMYNLPQQDMIALRAVMRLAWQVPNPITIANQAEATRYPFAALRPGTTPATV